MNKSIAAIVAIILFTFTGFSSRQYEESLEGEYVAAEFEFYSLLILKKDKEFEYKYALGGCQGSISGRWNQEKDKIILVSEDQDTINSSDSLSPFYPVFANDYWKIRKGGVRPEKLVNTGCFQTKQIHKKR